MVVSGYDDDNDLFYLLIIRYHTPVILSYIRCCIIKITKWINSYKHRPSSCVSSSDNKNNNSSDVGLYNDLTLDQPNISS